MTLALTKADMRKAGDRIVSLQRRVESVKKKGEEIAIRVVRTAEVSGTAFGLGVIQGKTGGVEIMGVPLELAVAGAAAGLGYLGAAGKMSDHLINVGDGALAAYATTMGRGVGLGWKERGVLGNSEEQEREQPKIKARSSGDFTQSEMDAIRMARTE